jgi:hypothetical protein
VGLAVKGLQIFMPLSPKLYLALFDPTTYQYGSEARQSCGLSRRDVATLNQMQAVNGLRCMYFLVPPPDDEAASWTMARGSHESLHAADLQVYHGEENGRPSDLVTMGNPSLRMDAKLSFARVIDQARYAGYRLAILPIRSPELVAMSERQAEGLDAFIDRQRTGRGRA